MLKTLKLLKQLYKDGKISAQQYRTYRGQVLSGNEEAALVGMRRKKLI